MKKGILIPIILIPILILTIFLVLNNHPEQTTINPEESTDYVGEQTTIFHKDFKAIMKKDWQETELSPSLYVYVPGKTSINDSEAEYILISISSLENNNLTLNEILEQGIESSKKLFPDFELTENINGGNDYLEGKRIKFKATQDNILRNNVQVFGIKYENLYSITYSCPTEKCDSYPVFNSLIETFQPVEDKNYQ
jgi:hypothetical protein